jgi:phospholipid transport system transporter-binding protein
MLLLPQTLTMAEARDAVRMLAQSLRADADGGAGELVIDASAVTRFDSAALAVLLECARQARAWGRALRVTHMPRAMQELATLYGVAELLRLDALQPQEGMKEAVAP